MAATTTMTALRIRPDDLDQITRNAEQHGMSRTAWMIAAALNYEPQHAESELDDIRRRLARLETLAGL